MLQWVCEWIANWILAAAIPLFRRAAGARRNVFTTSILPSLEEMSFTNILTEEALNLLKYISFQIYSYYGFWQVTVTSLSDIFGSLSIFLIGVHSPRTLTYTWHRVRTLFSGSNQYLTVGSRGPPTADPSPARVIGHRHRRRMTTMPPGLYMPDVIYVYLPTSI